MPAARITSFSWNSVYGEKSYAADDGGIYEWKIKFISVDDDNNDSWEMVIGVGGSSQKVTYILTTKITIKGRNRLDCPIYVWEPVRIL